MPMMHPDDERLGHLLRAIRRRTGLTQAHLALMAGVPRRDVIAVEAGRAGGVELERLRRLFSELDARFKPAVWWRGAAADRLLDERHAALTEIGVVVLARRGWQTAVEVSFSEFGERGSVDILGFHAATRAAVAAEVKGWIGSLEETTERLT